MTAKNRVDIQTEIDSLLADNSTGDISPADVRTVHETSKDSNLNLLDTSGTQTVAGTVNYTGDLQKSGVTVQRLPTKRTLVLAKADFPAPASGVITLADNMEYVLGADVSLGTDRIVMGDNCSVKGIESIAITLTYTGTGDMFTASDKTCRVANMTIACASGRIWNWTCTAVKVLRMNDVSISSCNKFGLFTSVSGVLRFTNVSPAAITTDGLEFSGDFASFLWEVSASTVNGGALFNLGTSTFDSFIATTILATLGVGTNLISGQTGSANINTGGNGLVTVMRISGSGTPLSGVSVDDALWEFHHNDDIPDTRPDCLLSMIGNATNTVISVAGTPVLVSGTWTVERSSQMTGSTAGRTTYNGGKDSTLPITAAIVAAPVSGTNKDITVYVAKNGTVVTNSKRTVTISSGSPKSITIPWQDVFSTTDYYEVFVANETDTTDVLVSDATFRIN